MVFLEQTKLVPALGPLHLLFRQLGAFFSQKVTRLGLILHLDPYSNVNFLGIPVLIPQLKIVTIHPYYFLLHSTTLTLHYIVIGLTIQSMSSLVRYRLHEALLFTALLPATETVPST